MNQALYPKIGHFTTIAVWLLVFAPACDKKDDAVSICLDPTAETVEDCSEEVVVTASNCILQKVIHEYGGANLYTYHHNGEYYDQITYFEDYQDSLRYRWTMDLEYEPSGRIARTIKRFNSSHRHEVDFDYRPSEVFVTYTGFDSLGNVDFTNTNELFFPEAMDSTFLVARSAEHYPMNLSLFEYERGNRVRTWEPDENGKCELYGHRWVLESKSYYDDRPNVFNEYALLVTTGWEFQFWFKGNANNLIADSNPSNPNELPTISCHTFLTNGEGKYWIKNYRGRIYYYDCE